MHTEPRRGPIEVLVLHDNEGPQGPNAAENLAGYLQHIDGGYHAIFDNQNTVTVVGDDIEVWGNGGINSRSLDGCLIGYASGQWTDAYSVAEIQRAALWCASKCREYGIPPIHLTPREVATPGVKGICRHWDVTLAGFAGSAGHTDPGEHFPIEAFVRQVGGLLAPVHEPDEEYEDMIIDAPKRQQKNPVRPACARLDIAGKKVILMNGARLQQKDLNVPAQGEIRGWYETFAVGGRKKGFKVIGQRDPSGNPAFEFLWAK